jgi:hypothetical protein
MSIDDPIERCTEKYTGHGVTAADLDTAADALCTELADMLRGAVYSPHSNQHQLLQVAATLQDTAMNIHAAISTTAGQPVRHLNSMGELLSTGVCADMLIALRADRIEHLRRLAWLWLHRGTPADPADTAPGAPTT